MSASSLNFSAGAGAGEASCCHDVPTINPEDLTFRPVDDSSFLGMNVEQFGSLLVEDIPTSISFPIAPQLALAPEYQGGLGLCEAVQPVTQQNKESLVNVLECFEALECSRVAVCINRSNGQAKNIISSLLATGFSLMPSPPSAANFVWLSTDL